jgi:hypothetical protein
MTLTTLGQFITKEADLARGGENGCHYQKMLASCCHLGRQGTNDPQQFQTLKVVLSLTLGDHKDGVTFIGYNKRECANYHSVTRPKAFVSNTSMLEGARNTTRPSSVHVIAPKSDHPVVTGKLYCATRCLTRVAPAPKERIAQQSTL